LRNLGSLVKSSSSSDSLEAVRYLVWNGSLKRYLKPAELVFLDGYSRLSATVVQYYAEFSTNPVYWAASVRTSRVWRAGLDLHLPGLPPRGWEVQFGGIDLQCFYSSKLKSNAAALYYLLMVKLRVHSLAAVAEWLVLYLFQMVLEWGAKRFRYLAAGVEELGGAAGRCVADLVQWARKHLDTKAADLLHDLPPAVQRSLRPLGFGTYFSSKRNRPFVWSPRSRGCSAVARTSRDFYPAQRHSPPVGPGSGQRFRRGADCPARVSPARAAVGGRPG
jgi:hypothetical protein